MIRLLKPIFTKFPPLRWFYKKYRRVYYVKIKNLFRTTYISLYVMEGTDLTGNHPLVIGFAGKDSQAQAYWAQRAFAPGYRKHFVGRYWFWEIQKALQKSHFDCDMLLIKTNWLTAKRYSLKPGFKIPTWIEMYIDCTRPEKITKKSPAIKRRMQKYNLTYEISRDLERFDEFYYNMYLTHVKKRYGETAELYEYDYLKDIFSHAEVHFVKKDEIPLAGTLVECRGGKVKLRVSGIKDGNTEYLRYGIDGAGYYYAAVEMQKRGYKYINIGETRPVLQDGLTQFKMSLDAEIMSRSLIGKEYLWLTLLKDSPGLRSFLEQNPFVYCPKGHKPFRAIFADDDRYATEIEFKKDLKATNCKGLEGTHLFVFGEKEKIDGWLRSMGESLSCIKPAEDYLLGSY